jgi:hypothetical protein
MNTKPEKRATINDICRHAWTNNGNRSTLDLSHQEEETILFTDAVVEKLQQIGFAKEDVDEYATLRKPGPLKAAHYMLFMNEKQTAEQTSTLASAQSTEDKNKAILDDYFLSLQPRTHEEPRLYPAPSAKPSIRQSLVNRIKFDRMNGYNGESAPLATN